MSGEESSLVGRIGGLVGPEYVIRLDEGSSSVIGNLVEEAVGCHRVGVVTIEEMALIPGLNLAVICNELVRLLPHDSPMESRQCVVMGGDLTRCPLYGTTPDGKSVGNPIIIKRLKKLQREIKNSLTHSPTLNYHTLAGSELDPNR